MTAPEQVSPGGFIEYSAGRGVRMAEPFMGDQQWVVAFLATTV